jgi:UDPglucose 6-dehydrogenase
MREAPSRVLLESLWAVGARVQAFDPEAMDEARRLYGDRLGLQLTDTKEAALEGANALVILTEWLNFRIADFALIRERLVDRVVFDGRNIFEPVQLAREDLTYYSIGRAVAGASR